MLELVESVVERTGLPRASADAAVRAALAAIVDGMARGVQAKNDKGIHLYDLELEILEAAEVEVIDRYSLRTTTVEDAKAHAREALRLTHDTK